MAQQTITALFDKRADATNAISQLVTAGIPRTSIKLMPETDTPATTTTTSTSYDSSRDEKGFWASLGDFFMPDEDRYTYAEAMHRGSIMVTVSADAAHAERAADILEQNGTIDIDERENSWRKEGWSGYQARSGLSAGMTGASGAGAGVAMPGGGVTGTSRTAASGARATGAGNDEVLPVVEEQLRVGKRQVSGGRVKVRSYVVETPVSEQVRLHTENVHVERRPVDRAIAPGDDAFRERTIEATAVSEEAVVAKQARVTGEVHVRKEAADRTETVKDTVRSTKVEVEDGRVEGKPGVNPTTQPPRR